MHIEALTPWLLLTLLLVCSASGCVWVETRHADGRSESAIGIGVLVTPAQDAVIGNARVLGIHHGPLGTTLGYSRRQVVIDTEKCRLVVWLDDGRDAEAVLDEIRSMSDACAE